MNNVRKITVKKQG